MQYLKLIGNMKNDYIIKCKKYLQVKCPDSESSINGLEDEQIISIANKMYFEELFKVPFHEAIDSDLHEDYYYIVKKNADSILVCNFSLKSIEDYSINSEFSIDMKYNDLVHLVKIN